MENLAIFDSVENGYLDRYTVIYLDEPVSNDPYYNNLYLYAGMSERPFHPQGIGQHGEIKISYSDRQLLRRGKGSRKFAHLGKKITFDMLPEDCQNLVKQDMQS